MAQQRKGTQRERLLRGMVEVANRRGYAGANVSAVIAAAGVSRPTFYEYFVDRDDCFVATIEHAHAELLTKVTQSLVQATPQDATRAAITALVGYASANKAMARFLMDGSMAGGARALDARDRGIVELAAAIEHARRLVPADGDVADLEARLLVASIYRVLAARLRRGQAAISRLSDPLLRWVAAYDRPPGELRWQTLSSQPPQVPSRHLPEAPVYEMPPLLGPGRPRISEEEIAENHRLRILYAVARLAETKGYTATTVAEIAQLASVAGRVFYRFYADKQEAFAAAHELGFRQVMDVTTRAFFAEDGWPERSWEAGCAFTQLLQANPLVAHVGFVEAYAVGPGAVQRIESSHDAFMFLLQEGLVRQTLPTGPPPRVAMEAIIAGIFEIVYLQARRADEPQIAAMLPHIAHLWLTPFLGVAQADAFIDGHTVH
jgi:AcrR family transcriptional regulator